jgi:hypothetical protein
MKTINTYYYNGNHDASKTLSNKYFNNFGDLLGPQIIEYLTDAKAIHTYNSKTS